MLILTCYNQHPLHLRIYFNQLYLKFHTDKLTLTCTLANKMITQSCKTLYNFFMIEYHLVVCRKPPFLKAKIMVEWEEDQNELPMMTGITQANF